MFRRRVHNETIPTDVHAPRAGPVRLLETEEELRAAVERARAFQRMSAGLEAIRALRHERYLHEPSGSLADVALTDTDRPAAPGQRPREPR